MSSETTAPRVPSALAAVAAVGLALAAQASPLHGRPAPDADVEPTPADSVTPDSIAEGPPSRQVAHLARAALRRPGDERVWTSLPRALRRLARSGVPSARQARVEAERIAVRALELGAADAPRSTRTSSGRRRPDGAGWLASLRISSTTGEILAGLVSLAAIAGLLLWMHRRYLSEAAPRRRQVTAARLLLRLGASPGSVAQRTGIARDAIGMLEHGRSQGHPEIHSGTNFRSSGTRPSPKMTDGNHLSTIQRLTRSFRSPSDGEHGLHPRRAEQ